MVIGDLKQSCPRCGGSGRQAGISQLGIPQINLSGLCGECDGRGFLLTELGRDVLELLRPFMDEMIEARLVTRAAEEAARVKPAGS